MFCFIKKYSHIFIHLFMMIGVTLYVIFGAYIMQSLENNGVIEMNEQLRNKRNVKVEENLIKFVENKTIHYGTNYLKNLSGHELAKLDHNLHNCVLKAMESLFNFSHCHEKNINVAAITLFDYCYKSASLNIQGFIENVNKFEKPIYGELYSENDNNIKYFKEQHASVFFKKKFRHGQLKINKLSDNNTDTVITDQTSLMDWSFGSSIIFAFSVITTIGYGHVAPMTTSGRIFTVIYGLIGVPFTLLTVANVGLFLSNIFRKTAIKMIVWKHRYFDTFMNEIKIKKKIKNFENVNKNVNCCCLRKSNDELIDEKIQSVVWYTNEIDSTLKFNHSDVTSSTKENNNDEIDESNYAGTIQLIMTLLLGVTTFFYILIGAYIVHLYEVDMNFFQALYFNFITLTTIGLGDFVPQSYNYLALTIAYVFIGMALVTITLNLLSDILKKLHNFGRKIENVGDVVVWFGGNKMKMSKLMMYLVDTFNLPEETLQKMNVDTFIDNAIQKENGKLESLKPKPFTLSDVADRYSRDIEAETCFMDATERSSNPISDHFSTRKSAKSVLETITHKITPISSINEEELSEDKLINDFKIQLDSLNTDRRWSSFEGITRKSSSEVFYLPTFETCSRSIDNSSFDDITIKESEKIIY